MRLRHVDDERRDMRKSHKTQSVLIGGLMTLSLALGSALLFAQGGTGRETGNANVNKTPRKTSNQPSRPTRGDRSASRAKESDESSATLEETLNWIGQKLTTAGFNKYVSIMEGHSGNIMETFRGNPLSSYHIDGCTLTVEWTFGVTAGQGQRRLIFPLADIDRQSIGANFAERSQTEFQSIVFMKATKPTLKLFDSEYRMNQSGSSVQFLLANKDDQESFLKALRHAVRLCGG